MVILVLISITMIATYRAFGVKASCLVDDASNKLGFGTSDNGTGCKDDDASKSASNSPAPSTGGYDKPSSEVVCVGQECSQEGQCFVAGTLITTDKGLQSIESIAVGARVLSRDEDGDAVDWKPVLRAFNRRTSSLVALTIGDGNSTETIEVTPDHRVRAQKRGWVPVNALIPGQDLLLDADGNDLYVLSAESIATDTTVSISRSLTFTPITSASMLFGRTIGALTAPT